MTVAEQSIVLYAAERGYLEDVELAKVLPFETALLAYAHSQYADFVKQIDETGNYNDEIESKLKALLESFKSTQTW